MFKKGNQFGKLNKGRKRPDLVERNRRGMNKKTRDKLSKSKKDKGFVFRPEHPCPRCKSIHVCSSTVNWRCVDCGKTWTKNPKGREHLKVFNPDHPCPRCGSTHVGSFKGKRTDGRYAYFLCHNCGKSWVKNPKPKGWRVNNLPKPKLDGKLEEIKRMSKSISQRKIAKKLYVTQTAISQLMKRNKIKARPKHIWSNRNPKKQKEINKKISKALKGNTNWRFSHEFPNSEERKLIRFFKKWELPFGYVGDGSFKIDCKCPDFIYKEKKLIIEFFGELWHAKEDEEKRVIFFKERGWNCLVVWGRETGRYETNKTYLWERRLNDKIIRWLAGLSNPKNL